MSPLSTAAPDRGESRGVAPAVTVGLLVGVTIVISMITLAGVFFISADTGETPPQAMVDVESHADGMLTITHESGDPLRTEDLSVVGPDTERDQFGDRTLTAGERIDVAIEESGTASVVWESGDTSTTLEEFQAPGMGNWTELRTKLENDEDITLQHDYTSNSPGYDQEALNGGSGTWTSVNYNGTLDGNGHEIREISIAQPGFTEVGFIDILKQGAEIKNLDVVDLTVTGEINVGFIAQNEGGTVSNVDVSDASISATHDNGYSIAGILVGDIEAGTIRDSSVEGTVDGDGANVGALAGENEGTITDSSAEGNVNGTGGVGGLVGSNHDDITDSSADVSVTGTDWDVGGLVGGHFGSNITHSYATGDVTGDSLKVGGLVGANLGNITESYATGDVEGGGFVGGLTGLTNMKWWKSPATITESYATGDVYGTGNAKERHQFVGGLSGFSRGQIETSYAVGNVAVNGAEYHVGGLLGGTNGNGNGNTADSYWDTKTTGQSVGIDAGPDTGTTGLTTAEMTGGDARSSMSGFDFSSVWDTTGEYPAVEALD